LAKIVAIQVLGVQWKMNEHFPFLFHEIYLRNRLNEHLNTIVGMYFQTFYTLNIFPYDTCFEDWKEQKPKQALD
jgi:hypothetical protein